MPTSISHIGLGWKNNLAASTKPGMLVEKLQQLPTFARQKPEEEGDNWDDDFEGGISLTKLHGSYYVCRECDFYSLSSSS